MFDKVLNLIGAGSAGVNDGDYVDDATGLLHCGKCGEAKQLILAIPEALMDRLGETRVVWRACACRRAEVAREEEVKREAERLDNIKKLRRRGIEDFVTVVAEVSFFDNFLQTGPVFRDRAELDLT